MPMPGLRLLSKLKRFLYKNPRPSLNGLDRKLERYLSYRDGFFIEAGANDGYSQSNTYYLEKKLGWRGILVEGIPELYQQCKKQRPASSVYPYALVAPDYQQPTVTMHYAHLMSVVDGSMGSAEEQARHLQSGVQVQDLKGSYTVDVPARTLESILDEFEELPQIDFFSLDVEGYELPVLQGLNLAKHSPKYILVEARFFEEVDTFLQERYHMIEQLTQHDYLYRLKGVSES